MLWVVVLNRWSHQCLSRSFLNDSVPFALTTLLGRLFQSAMTLWLKNLYLMSSLVYFFDHFQMFFVVQREESDLWAYISPQKDKTRNTSTNITKTRFSNGDLSNWMNEKSIIIVNIDLSHTYKISSTYIVYEFGKDLLKVFDIFVTQEWYHQDVARWQIFISHRRLLLLSNACEYCIYIQIWVMNVHLDLTRWRLVQCILGLRSMGSMCYSQIKSPSVG